MTRTLRTARLGTTGLQITRVGFGAWAIGGGGGEFDGGPQDDDESIDAVHRALELGVNWIDTAIASGFGRAKERAGRTLEGVTERPHVFSKSLLAEGPRRSVSYDLSRDQVDPLLPAADLDLPAGGLAEIEGGNR